jgi:lambda family phage portal protein
MSGPTFLDRALIYLAPAAGARRLMARAAVERYMASSAGQGGFRGARRDRRAMRNWLPGGGSADADLLPDLAALRERARDADRNIPVAAGAVNTKVTSIVGTGLRYKARIDRRRLGLSEEAADRWETDAQAVFALWAESADCDLARTQDFYEQQDLVLRNALISGDLFTDLRFAELAGFPFGTRLQHIEADRVSNPNFAADRSGLAGGVELDALGAPVAYHVLDRHPGDALSAASARKWIRIPAFDAATGRRRVLHHFNRLRPGQTRGIPDLAPVIEALKQIADYTDAELTAAVISACFAVVSKTESGQGLTSSPLAKSQDTGSDVGAAAGALAKVDIEFAPGLVVDGLKPNESIASFQSGRPSPAFDPFFLAICRQIGVALELPYELLVKHFTASYSAARAALLEAWKFFRKRRQWLVRSFCQPALEAVLWEAAARGYIEAPGFFDDPFLRRAWCGARWIGPAMGALNPKDEVGALLEAVAGGLTTLDDATAEYNGGDWETNHPQQAKERRRRAADGLLAQPAPAPAGARAAGADRDRPEGKDAA